MAAVRTRPELAAVSGADDPVTRWDMRLPMDASIYRALEEMLGKSADDEVKLEESGSLNAPYAFTP